MKSDEEIQNEAMAFVKKKNTVRILIEKFGDPKKIRSDTFPISVFMAGSPGAGKTEFSKQLIAGLWEGEGVRVVRIDADEIRSMLPGYSGGNAYLFQGSVSVGVEKLHDSALRCGQNFVLDGTLTNLEKAKKNIQRSLDKKRTVFIFYIHQDPVIAWKFTAEREKKEGRRILKETFVEQYFKAKETVQRIKDYFGQDVRIYLVEKNFEQDTVRLRANIDRIDKYVISSYNKEQLEKLL